MTRAFLIGWVFLLLACRVLAEQLTLVGINDTHARLDRMPRLAALVGQLRQEDPDLILLSAGDHNTGNPVSDMDPIYSGRPMIEMFNLMGVDVSCVGNHEFDRGMAALARQMRESRFPYVCANMQAPPSTGMRLVPWVILERKGLRIGACANNVMCSCCSPTSAMTKTGASPASSRRPMSSSAGTAARSCATGSGWTGCSSRRPAIALRR